MGGCASTVGKQVIMETGQRLLHEFFKRSTFEQMSAAFAAPEHCGPPRYDPSTEELQDFMQCAFLNGQKKSWSVVWWLLVALSIAVVILSIVVIRLTLQLIKTVSRSTTRYIYSNRQSIEAAHHREGSSNRYQNREPNRAITEMDGDVLSAWL